MSPFSCHFAESTIKIPESDDQIDTADEDEIDGNLVDSEEDNDTICNGNEKSEWIFTTVIKITKLILPDNLD